MNVTKVNVGADRGGADGSVSGGGVFTWLWSGETGGGVSQ